MTCVKSVGQHSPSPTSLNELKGLFSVGRTAASVSITTEKRVRSWRDSFRLTGIISVFREDCVSEGMGDLGKVLSCAHVSVE